MTQIYFTWFKNEKTQALKGGVLKYDRNQVVEMISIKRLRTNSLKFPFQYPEEKAGIIDRPSGCKVRSTLYKVFHRPAGGEAMERKKDKTKTKGCCRKGDDEAWDTVYTAKCSLPLFVVYAVMVIF